GRGGGGGGEGRWRDGGREGQGCPVGAAGLGSRLAAGDDEDDVAGLLSRLNVRGRVDYLLQGVTAVDARPVLPRLDELLEEEDVLLGVPRGYREHHPLVPDPRGPQSQGQRLQGSSGQVHPAPVERAFAAPERELADRVEDHVVGLAVG